MPVDRSAGDRRAQRLVALVPDHHPGADRAVPGRPREPVCARITRPPASQNCPYPSSRGRPSHRWQPLPGSTTTWPVKRAHSAWSTPSGVPGPIAGSPTTGGTGTGSAIGWSTQLLDIVEPADPVVALRAVVGGDGEGEAAAEHDLAFVVEAVRIVAEGDRRGAGGQVEAVRRTRAAPANWRRPRRRRDGGEPKEQIPEVV